MEKMVRTLTTIFACFASLFAAAQDLTGIWRGIFYNEYEMLFRGTRYRYEVQIKTNGLQAKGVTYSYQATLFYGKASLVGKWTPTTNNLTLVENKMLEIRSNGGGDGCLMTCYLRYRKDGDREFLEGTYSSVNAKNDTAQCGGGVVRLEKVQDSDFAVEDFLKETKPTGKAGVKPGQDKYLINKPTPNNTTGSSAAKSNTPQKSATAKATPPAGKNASSSTGKKPAASTQQPAPPSGSTAKTTPPKNSASNKPAAPGNKPASNNSVAKSNPPSTNPPAKSNSNPAPAAGTTAKTPAIAPPTPPQPAASASKTTDAGAKPKPTATAPPPVLKQRVNELVETISTAARKLDITFYDNGEIDGDTITVYANNKLVVAKKGLSAEPITISVALDDDDPIQEIVMVAENLGSIPPNTALMIVQAGAQRYAVRLSSNEQKNALVRFKYDPNALK